MRCVKVFALICALISPGIATAHGDMGYLDEPVLLEDYALRLHDGRATTLHALSAGKITALQMIFTACTSVCPIQGATFGALAEELAAEDLPFQLLSISIDADYDSPEALAAWRAQHYDGPGWVLGVSDFFSTLDLADQLLASKYGDLIADNPAPTVQGERPSEADHHASMVMILGPDARVIYRTFNFPEPELLRTILEEIRATGLE